ncbi:TraB/GumN family protein [Colwellia demingiae]|uniref:TraB/GumN family protein n=1 Tax=Colwellia demingiae TaxID=89401 RepID=A0A5C6QNK9_9GAMM|nr:TraB/GumN family protein [Colwellia demingiae]TWX70816.1 TraB/GumN family protein [Colwellia demingiae]
MIKSTYKHLFIGASLIAMSFVSLTAQAQSSVWKVSKGNDYIFIGGTVHILPPSEFPLPKEFDEAYKQSDSIVLEAKLPDGSDAGFQLNMMQQMTYSNGKTISSFLSTKTQQKLSQYVSSLGVDLVMFEHFKPGFLVTMLALLEAQKAQLSGEGVDIFYSKQATRDNKDIAYLESAEFQMNMIANMGIGDEDRFIKSNLEQMTDFKTMFLGLLKAWRVGDEQQLNTLAILPMKDDPKTFKKLLTDRNHTWISHIDRMFSSNGKSTDKEFVLVGVAHLAGDKSVLALLKAKGYRVEKL